MAISEFDDTTGKYRDSSGNLHSNAGDAEQASYRASGSGSSGAQTGVEMGDALIGASNNIVQKHTPKILVIVISLILTYIPIALFGKIAPGFAMKITASKPYWIISMVVWSVIQAFTIYPPINRYTKSRPWDKPRTKKSVLITIAVLVALVVVGNLMRACSPNKPTSKNMLEYMMDSTRTSE